MKAQVLAAREAFAATGRRLPLQCSVTLDPNGRMLLGTDVAAALATFEALGVEVVGSQLLDRARPHARRGALPVAERGHVPARHPQRRHPRSTTAAAPCSRWAPRPMAEILLEFVAEFGVNVVGGCCGTTPEHIRALAAAIGRRAPAPRPRPRRPGRCPAA